MRKISIFLTVLITSLALTLAGLVASPIASASENDGSISATFAFGSSVLTKAQKAAIKKALASSGTDVSFIVTGTAGKLPGVSDRRVQRLAKARANAIKAYLVSLGVNKTRVTTQVKMTKIGEAPKISNIYPTPAVTPTVTAAAAPAAAADTRTCAEKIAASATCIVGDRGPGGGIVFYVSAANFASAGSACSLTCKYLEVAPATWQDTTAPIYTTVADDLTYEWSNTNGTTGQNIIMASTEGIVANSSIEKVNWKIGEGFNNTSLMEVSGATSAAKVAVLLYAGNSTAGQWFIPSMNELNELCKYARGQTTGDLTVACTSGGTLKTGITNDLGGFVGGIYLSSSEYDATRSLGRYFSIANLTINGGKSSPYLLYVRPVRAF